MRNEFDDKRLPPRITPRRSLRRSWHRAAEGSLRHRFAATYGSRGGLPLLVMNLTGRARCGSYDVPRGRTLYYYPKDGGYGRGGYVTTYDRRVMDKHPREDWHWFDVQNDGFEIHMGYYDSRFFYLTRPEQWLFFRWWIFEQKIRGEWFGLRRWAYYAALHVHVASFQKRHRRNLREAS